MLPKRTHHRLPIIIPRPIPRNLDDDLDICLPGALHQRHVDPLDIMISHDLHHQVLITHAPRFRPIIVKMDPARRAHTPQRLELAQRQIINRPPTDNLNALDKRRCSHAPRSAVKPAGRGAGDVPDRPSVEHWPRFGEDLAAGEEQTLLTERVPPVDGSLAETQRGPHEDGSAGEKVLINCDTELDGEGEECQTGFCWTLDG